ncbi:hypothetical protein GCM10027277_32170 [Pseudoduganella ginsengisoli]|nr:sensor domain-containing diguanylate cyclase [Pseudoduganella ginsengisoli]
MENIPSSKLVEIIRAQVRLASLAHNLSAVMDEASGVAAQLADADGAVVELLEGDEIVYRSASGIAVAQLGLRMPVANSLSGYCLTNRCAALCTDSEVDERVNREACRRVGLRSMIIVPLMANGAAIAVMKLLWREPRTFIHAELEIVTALAGMAAVLMQQSAREGADVLQRRLTQDTTTGAANRSYFYEQLRLKIAAAERSRGKLAIAMIRVEGLRDANIMENFDGVLKRITRRIEGECREGDFIGRMGADEFAIILGMAVRQSVVDSQILRICQAIADEGHATGAGNKVILPIRAGSAIHPEEGATADVLIFNASAALARDGERQTLKLAAAA